MRVGRLRWAACRASRARKAPARPPGAKRATSTSSNSSSTKPSPTPGKAEAKSTAKPRSPRRFYCLLRSHHRGGSGTTPKNLRALRGFAVEVKPLPPQQCFHLLEAEGLVE